jgi:hypothetical protein
MTHEKMSQQLVEKKPTLNTYKSMPFLSTTFGGTTEVDCTNQSNTKQIPLSEISSDKNREGVVVKFTDEDGNPLFEFSLNSLKKKNKRNSTSIKDLKMELFSDEELSTIKMRHEGRLLNFDDEILDEAAIHKAPVIQLEGINELTPLEENQLLTLSNDELTPRKLS